MAWLDLVCIAAYILLIFLLSWRARLSLGGEVTARSQYLANNTLTFTESICSIIATEVSALTFLGIPAFAFNKDFGFAQIYLGAMIGRVFVALVFLPRVYGKGLTLYEVMAGSQKTQSGRRTVAAFYATGKLIYIGVRLFSGSILFASFLDVDLYVAMFATTFVAFLYTLIGGLKAVVRTDMLQLGLFILGGVLAHVLIPEIANDTWASMMAAAQAAGKTRLFDLANPLSIVAGVMGGILFDMSTHGVDQDFAQRLTANRSLRQAQLAIFFSSFISLSVGLLFLSVGALLWSFYQVHPFPASVPNADHLFAHFIVTYFPAGVRGLMVAGVLAATMSTLDSTTNALCATLYNDILPQRRRRGLATYFLVDNAAITFAAFLIAVSASWSSGVLLLGIKIQTWTAGSLLAVFVTRVVLSRYFPYRFSTTAVVGAYVFGMAGVATNTFWVEGNWNWNTYYGFGLALVFLWALSRTDRAPVT